MTEREERCLRYFWKYVEADGSGCAVWTGPTNGKYGCVCVYKAREYAHRYSYRMYRGDIPEGFVVMHACDNPLCVNPEHLKVGSQKENQRDMAKKGRGRSGPLPRGVYFSNSRFAATAGPKGNRRYLGTFNTAEEAGRAAASYCRSIYGEPYVY